MTRTFLLLCFAAASWGQIRVGPYEVTLRLPPAGLTAQEEMQIEYRVVDTTRVDPVMGPAPIIRAQARSVIDMPSMPGMAHITETAHPEGVPGEYGVHPVFPHGGDYRLQLFITPPGAAEFPVVFPLQVGDPLPSRNRKSKPPPYFAEARTHPRGPKSGEETEIEIEVRSRNGNTRIEQFDIQHERLMHLIIVRDDLNFFAHEHPALDNSGTFRLRFTFPDAGDYTLFADAAPKGAGGQVMPIRLRVSGKRPPRFRLQEIPLNAEAITSTLRIRFPATNFSTGRTLRLPVVLHGKDVGNPVTDLEPYLGALGHLILIHEDGETYVHSHPDELDPNAGKDGRIAFLARFPKAGRYRGWVQVQRAGRVETGIINVSAGAN